MEEQKMKAPSGGQKSHGFAIGTILVQHCAINSERGAILVKSYSLPQKFMEIILRGLFFC